MGKKQKKTLKWSPAAVKTTASLFVIGVFIVFLYRTISTMIFDSDFFTVKSISMDSSLDFIDVRDLSRVRGRNIFSVDLNDLQRRLAWKYPQVASLRVERRFPQQIHITAQKRQVFAQVELRGRMYFVDEIGVLIAKVDDVNETVPTITGVKLDGKDIIFGTPLRDEQLRAAIRAIWAFTHTPELSGQQIASVDGTQVSNMVVTLASGLKVIVDKDNISHKMKMLGVVLAEPTFDLAQTDYVDLRFKQPIRGKKAEKNVKKIKK